MDETIGTFCGMNTGRNIFVTGDFAVITFHSDYSFERRGFLIFLTFTPISKYNKLIKNTNYQTGLAVIEQNKPTIFYKSQDIKLCMAPLHAVQFWLRWRDFDIFTPVLIKDFA